MHGEDSPWTLVVNDMILNIEQMLATITQFWEKNISMSKIACTGKQGNFLCMTIISTRISSGNIYLSTTFIKLKHEKG